MPTMTMMCLCTHTRHRSRLIGFRRIAFGCERLQQRQNRCFFFVSLMRMTSWPPICTDVTWVRARKDPIDCIASSIVIEIPNVMNESIDSWLNGMCCRRFSCKIHRKRISTTATCVVRRHSYVINGIVSMVMASQSSSTANLMHISNEFASHFLSLAHTHTNSIHSLMAPIGTIIFSLSMNEQLAIHTHLGGAFQYHLPESQLWTQQNRQIFRFASSHSNRCSQTVGNFVEFFVVIPIRIAIDIDHLINIFPFENYNEPPTTHRRIIDVVSKRVWL